MVHAVVLAWMGVPDDGGVFQTAGGVYKRCMCVTDCVGVLQTVGGCVKSPCVVRVRGRIWVCLHLCERGCCGLKASVGAPALCQVGGSAASSLGLPHELSASILNLGQQLTDIKGTRAATSVGGSKPLDLASAAKRGSRHRTT